MSNRRILITVCVFWLLISSGVIAQVASSTNYGLAGGTLVGGGGASSSTNANMSGAIPAGPAGVSASTNYEIGGGTINAFLSGIAAAYVGAQALDTIPRSGRTLKVAVSGGTGALTGQMFYRQRGAVSYSLRAMAPRAGDTLEIAVGPDLLTARGIDYYFEVDRGGVPAKIGGADNPFTFIVNMTNAEGQRPAGMPEASYRIVGVPINLTGTSTVQAIFADDLGVVDNTKWRLGRFTAAADSVVEYPDAQSVAPHRGYWLIARDGRRYGAAGFSQQPNRTVSGREYYEIPMDNGWNQFANPLPFDIDLDSSLMDDNGAVGPVNPTVLEDAFYYNGAGYLGRTVIPAWEGAFMRATKSGVSLLVRFKEAGAAFAKQGLVDKFPDADWLLTIGVMADGKLDLENVVGVQPQATAGRDVFDLSEPPIAPEGVSLGFDLAEPTGRLHAVDLRAPFTDGAKWKMSLSEATGRVLTVDGLDELPLDLEAWLAFDIGSAVQLEAGRQIAVPDDAESATLIVGKSDYAEQEVAPLLPSEYALEQNFPNPFNPSTNIRFALPEASEVTLTVFNLLGREVATVVTGRFDAGVYTVTWDGSNGAGVPVASGVYFYRLSTEEYRETRKMLLLK